MKKSIWLLLLPVTPKHYLLVVGLAEGTGVTGPKGEGFRRQPSLGEFWPGKWYTSLEMGHGLTAQCKPLQMAAGRQKDCIHVQSMSN